MEKNIREAKEFTVRQQGYGAALEQLQMTDNVFFFNGWLHRISRILAILDYEGVKQATPEVLRPKRKSSAHFTTT